MSIERGHFPALLALLVVALAFGARAQSVTPAGSDDRARCETGDIDSCVRSEAARCDAGEAKACATLSRRYLGGVAVPRDQTRSEQIWARAFHLADSTCAADDLGGCAIAGLGYGFGRGTAQDLARARLLEERACAGGNADGCFAVAFASMVGMFGIERDAGRAARLLEDTCAGGHSNACFQLGWNYEFGRMVARDYARAAVFYHQACELASDTDDMMGCQFLGWAYDAGHGVAEDAAQAARLYDRACRGGNGSGCNNLGALVGRGRGVAKDESRATELFDRACRLGNPSGCHQLSGAYEHGIGVPRDKERAKQLRLEACGMGVRAACQD
jgi:TPR repeat protein